MTLVGNPQIIFLDEPTTGLDPRSRRTMWEIIRELVADGVTIFLTTQYLDEADQLADRIAVLDRGRIVAEGTPDELKRRIPGGHVRLRFADADELDAAAAPARPATRATTSALTLQVPGDGSVAVAARAARPARRALASTSRTSPSTRPTSTTSSSPSPARHRAGHRGQEAPRR